MAGGWLVWGVVVVAAEGKVCDGRCGCWLLPDVVWMIVFGR